MKAKYYITICLLFFLCICLVLFINHNLKKVHIKTDFLTSCRILYRQALKEYSYDIKNDHTNISYQKGFNVLLGTDIKALDFDDDYNYVIKLNKEGNITYFKVINKYDEIELGNLSLDEIVNYNSINEHVIIRNEEISNELFEFVSKSDQSGVNDRGYRLELIDGTYYMTIYLGSVNNKSYFKMDNVVENNNKFLVSINSFIDESKGELITPCMKIRFKKTPSSIIVSDVINKIDFKELK